MNLHDDMELMFHQWASLPMTQTFIKAMNKMKDNYISSAITESTGNSLTSEQLRNRLAYAKGIDEACKLVKDPQKVAQLTK